MKLFSVILLGLGMGMGAPVSAHAAQVPWRNGEEVVYEIHWGMIVAAEARVRVGKVTQGWESVLQLRSRGVVEGFFPIRSRFVSRFDRTAANSYGLEAVRHEGSQRSHQRLVLDPVGRSGLFENVLTRKQTSFKLPGEDCQDILSLLYATRKVAWAPGVTRDWDVCEKERVKRVRLTGEKGETLRDENGVRQDCYVLRAEQLPDPDGKVPRKPLSARIWVQKTNATPLRADLKFVYGTFRLSRVAAEAGAVPVLAR